MAVDILTTDRDETPLLPTVFNISFDAKNVENHEPF
jgi:hypothetical protein